MFERSRRAALLAGLVPLLLLAGCAKNRNRADTQYVARDVSTLYMAAKLRLDQGRYDQAAIIFDEVERQHPYSPWARRAQLMSAFSYYASRDYTKAIQSAQRFLSIHPGNRDAPYAYYLIALCYYEQIGDVTRDQKITLQARDALGELVRRFPDSRYAGDARLKLDLVNDHLAGKDMEIGRFYQRRKQWIAATLRFRSVVDNYQRTSHAPEALERLVECYLSLGIPEEAKRAAAVLDKNFPGSPWYERAYDLMREHASAEVSSSGARPAAVRPALQVAPAALASAPTPAVAPANDRLVDAAPPADTPAIDDAHDAKAMRKADAKARKQEAKARKAEARAQEEDAKARARAAKAQNCGKGGLFHRRKCDTPAAAAPGEGGAPSAS